MRLSILLLMLFFSQTSISQSSCKVKLGALRKSYTGECKKGFANGQGEAKGNQDSYKGAFKKGLPHGYGTYKWGNGNIYVGEFTKGKMDGKGRLTIKNESGEVTVQKGYFKKGAYLGEYKYPYAVLSKREVKSVLIREDASINTVKGIYLIRISFRYNGRQIIPAQVNVMDEGKSLIENQGNFVLINNVVFPNKNIEITFRTLEGFSGRVTLDVYKKGNWTIEIRI